MKLARFEIGGRSLIGLADGGSLSCLSDRIPGLPEDMKTLIDRWDMFREAVEAAAGHKDYNLADVRLRAPIERPGKIFCIGLNYADHALETGMEAPRQLWFTKPQTSINGPYDPIERPIASEALDYEAELVVVIGKRCRHVAAERAHEVIFGYCVGNDVSVRDWQFHSSQMTIGKSFDTHAPFGPWIVTPDEIDPEDLGIRTFVNGEKRQDSNTRHLIFKCADQIAYLSQAMTLEPGDILFTGTPAGVGVAMKPPKWLKAGDKVRVEIDGIGVLENSVVDERLPA